ncbi:MAG TPA: serine hydrolase domain-containing protein, partial [Thermoanaerobaculia bacterium]|nr:serine hydrolase domain-containing protein [Thermoanaerobaculia bacterium]
MKKLILLFLITTAVLAQAPGEDRAMGWFRAFNSGSFEEMDAFVRANYTSEAQQRMTADVRKQRFEQMRGEFGKLQPVNVSTTPQGLQIDAQSEKGARATFRFMIDPAAPHLINGVGVDVGGPGEAGPALPPLSLPKDASLANTLDAYVRKLDEFSGVVLVARNNDVLFERAYGLATRRWNVPNKVTTRFDVGSITKDFTKVAVTQLVQAGKLKLDAPVITYLPDYPNKEWAQKATVRQLVDHTSGLGDIFTKRFWESNTIRLRTPKDFIQFFGNDPLQFEPGKGRRYSNYGYVVLGAVIEAASGENYYDYIQKHVFDAVPMRGSGFFDFRKPIPDVALGHSRRLPDGTESKEWIENRGEFARGIPAGLSFSSARDLFVFERAWRGGKLGTSEVPSGP